MARRMARNARKQKPWNKVQRTEKFWVGSQQLEAANDNQPIVLTGSTAQYVQGYTAEQLNANYPAVAGSPGLRALQNGKLHRFQGAIWCWLDPSANLLDVGSYDLDSAPGGTHVVPNIGMLTYAWMKVSEGANFNTLNAPLLVGDFNTRPDQDLRNVLLRDDVISWGSIPVFGIVPRNLTAIIGGTSLLSAVTGQHGQYQQDHVARIPFPRVPNGGFTLRKGEGLYCVAAQWPGPASATVDPMNAAAAGGSYGRDILVYPVTRALCSN